MSSFKINARCKTTDELHEVWCLDDYFGRHQYGYLIGGGDKALREVEFYNQYEPEDTNG